jgi:hypothetical protein
MSPPALLVDLDGTLFHIGDRSPYDADQCGLDTVNPAVRTVIEWAQGAGWAIVFASGRGFKASHRYATEQALFWNQIDYDALFMRRPGDDRKDDVVKEEIYREQIADAYDVRLVLDDRSSVVRMWRRLGLTCFQVDDRLD